MGVRAEHTVLLNGAGTTVGFAAVQIALRRGSRVIATAGKTFADQLRGLGASVTAYGEGMLERVLQMTGSKSPDLILDTALASGTLPALFKIAGDPKRVVTISDFAAAKELGVRANIEEPAMRVPTTSWGSSHSLQRRGNSQVPVRRTFPLGGECVSDPEALFNSSHHFIVLNQIAGIGGSVYRFTKTFTL